MSEYVTGADAIDLARMTELDLHRGKSRIGDKPDVHWTVADYLVSTGVDPEEFFMDLGRMKPADLATIIQSLIGLWKARHDYCIT